MKKLFVFIISIIIPSLHAQNFEWAKSMGSINGDFGNAICVDIYGNVYTIGSFNGTVDFDPGPGVFTMVSNGGSDAFIQKLDSTGNLVWVKRIGGSSTDGGSAIKTDAAGNVYLGGSFTSTVDLNPDIGTANFTSGIYNDIFLVKLDSAGAFVWAKVITGTDNKNIQHIYIDPAENILTTGFFNATADFDPGAGTFNLNSSSSSADIFIQKLDPAGNFVWAKKFGNSSGDQGNQVISDSSLNVYVTGNYSGSVDFDPAPGPFLSGSAGTNAFVLKLDPAGAYVWVKGFAGTGPEEGNSIALDNAGNIYCTGYFNGLADFDPGAGTYNLNSGVSANVFLVKLDNNGNFAWANQVGGSTYDAGSALKTDAFGSIYTAGFFYGTVDFDPGVGITNLVSNGSGDNIFVQKLDSSGNFIWAVNFGGTSDYSFVTMDMDPQGNIYNTGYFAGVYDFDPSPSSFNLTSIGDYDIFVHKLSQDLCSNMALVFDSVSSISCTSLNGYAAVHATGGISPYTYTWNTVPPDTDSYTIFTNPGLYNITINDQIGCSRSSTILINGATITSGFDMDANMVMCTFHPGFSSHIWIDALNDGCQSQSGQLTLVLDSLLSYNSSIPTPDNIIGNMLVWNIDSMNYDSSHFIVQLDVNTSALAVIGDSIDLQITILPTSGDFDSTNNVKNYVLPVLNGYDPNDKKVYPQGECNQGYVLMDQKLTYTIRFQNTGNDEAINIFVLDSLDPALDLNTVRVIANSHPVITEVLPGNVLKFRFDSILLPDSNTNELLSHGYVIFEVEPDSDVTINTPIENTSHIFFDFNPAVVTNTVHNILVNSIPDNSVGNISQSACYSSTFNGYTYTLSGIYTQHLDNFMGCDSTLILDLTIYHIDDSISQTGYTLTANQPSATYQWIDCNSNQPIAGETNQSFTATVNGDYAVIVTANGCTDTSACQTIFGFGLDENNFAAGIAVSPNPVQTTINISSVSELKNATITMVDMNGQIVLQKNSVNGFKYNMDLSFLNNSMYFIKILSEGKQAVVKIIKN